MQLSHTWAACQKSNIQIIGQDLPFAQKQTNDTELMRVFICQGYRKTDLKCINWCRMYTQAIYLSDICMTTRDALEKFCWQNPTKSQALTNGH